MDRQPRHSEQQAETQVRDENEAAQINTSKRARLDAMIQARGCRASLKATSTTAILGPLVPTEAIFKHGDRTFLWVGSVMFKLQTAVCGTPLVVFGSFRKERRPQGS